MTPRPVADRRAEADRFDLRRIHPVLRFGSASDRYAAWIDQIYPRDVWAGEVTTRKKSIGGQPFEERLLPVASVEDYFQHFGVLEIDFTFYRPLLEADGKPSSNLFTLEHYADAAPANARFVLKAPQQFLARKLRRKVDGRFQYVENPDFLDAEAFTTRFLIPAQRKLGVKLAGIILEQAYERAAESPPPEAFVAEWDRFISEVPEAPYHLEVRSAHQLSPAYLEWLANRDLGFCFSQWQWLPPLIDQWALAGKRFTSASGEAIVRLVQPRDMDYATSWRLAYPFDGPAAGLSDTAAARRMIDETTALMHQAAEAGVVLNVIGNNRAWGNTPDLARTLAHRFLDFAERRGA
ncbi:DUF72 domain-containing protein [Rubrivirga sp. IMCC43871]|uniref:DUF72 domain-containing protein n=1 Tax=Rubrivirga sp. IMCC43871 TaxID=3391575 RepID=UPI0039901773